MTKTMVKNAFSGRRGTYAAILGVSGQIAVWDSIAGHYTTVHSLTPRQIAAAIRRLTGSHGSPGAQGKNEDRHQQQEDTKMSTKYYICHDDNTIAGIGHTPEEARENATEWADTVGRVQPCSKALFDQVESEGGCIAWDEADGVARTIEERDSLSLDEILAEADIDLSEVSTGQHESGYQHLVVQVEHGGIVDASLVETTDGYYRSMDDSWHQIYRYGLGSCPCNCDSCAKGGDPADGVGDDDLDQIQGEIEIKIEEVLRGS